MTTPTYLFYDTETTGLPDWHKPSDAPQQPHIVQLTALLTDERGEKLSSMDMIVRPDGWKIPQEVVRLHGIDEARAIRGGVSEETAIEAFWDLLSRATLRIAHGDSFDYRILRIAFKRHGWHEDLLDKWKAFESFCTMKAATPIVKAAPTAKMQRAGRNHIKTVKLSEAFEFFTGQEMKGAHNAMYDVLAMKRVFFALLDYQGTAQPAPQPKRAPKAAAKPKAEPKKSPVTSNLI